MNCLQSSQEIFESQVFLYSVKKLARFSVSVGPGSEDVEGVKDVLDGAGG